jgi:hypothetical protein
MPELQINADGSSELRLGSVKVGTGVDLGRPGEPEPPPEFVEINGARKRRLTQAGLSGPVTEGYAGVVRIKMPDNE